MNLHSYLARTVLMGALLTLAAAETHAATVITGGTETSTVSGTSAKYMIGYDFVAVKNLSLTSLGFWDQGSNGLPGTHQVGLWNTTTKTLLASAFLDSADSLDTSVTVNGGRWRYETLGAPVVLLSGNTYTLAYQVGASLLPALDALYINYPTLTTSSANVTSPNTFRFFDTGGAFAFPTRTDVAGALYAGQLNAQYTVIAVPEPTTALFGLVLAGFCGTARRRRPQATA